MVDEFEVQMEWYKQVKK